MNRLVTLVTISLATPLFAQTTSIPPGYEATEYGNHGNGSCTTLGAHADQHCQVLSGDKLPAGTWKSLQFRESRYSSTGTARSWKNMNLSIGPHDYSSKSLVFAANFTSTPTSVFTGSINFAENTSTVRPVWGNFAKADDMTIPFSSSYSHSGTTGTCFDFTFQSGALANAGTWTGANLYYIDGLRDANSSYYNQAVTYIYGKTTGCPTGQGAYGYLVPFQRNYGVNDTTTTTRDGQSRLYFRATNLSANSAAMGVANFFQPYLTPKAFPGSCQNLYLDISGTRYPYVMFPFKTDGGGDWNGNAATAFYIKYNPALVGIRIWSQAAYDHPTLGFELSMGGSTWFAPQPPVTELEMLQANDANASNASGTAVTKDLPIMRVR